MGERTGETPSRPRDRQGDANDQPCNFLHPVRGNCRTDVSRVREFPKSIEKVSRNRNDSSCQFHFSVYVDTVIVVPSAEEEFIFLV